MNEKTVLVIDDSATIRRLVDGELSNAGYRVLMAPTAEEGVATAAEQKPDLIILDHQLPGATGYDVACQLLENEITAKIPVVASSTLRKKAYAEYLECDNVVDMLPKPYTPEALIATAENAINTAQMVVQSQCEGSAVPEVIDELGESDLAGAFGCFGLREVLDLLNNGIKTGRLEIETERYRVFVYVDKGRVQAVTASGVEVETVARHMPESLSELAPVIKFTIAGRRGSEVEGLVELLNNKVLDPRLLKKLLRIQAAVLLRICFTDSLKSFRFNQSQEAPTLFQKLPLDGSLLSLLVEGAMVCDESELPTIDGSTGYTRKAIRGQNLDRAGLSSRHMKLMNLLSKPVSLDQLSEQLGWPLDETLRVVHGFEMAELVEQCQSINTTTVCGLVTNAELGQKVGFLFRKNQNDVTGKFARDWLALRLLLRRQRPNVLLLEISDDAEGLNKFLDESSSLLNNVKVIGIHTASDPSETHSAVHVTLPQDCNDQELLDAIMARPTDTSTPIPAATIDQTTQLNAPTTEV